jgi:soluble lytic murein transglycosylase-like protein
VPPAAAVVVAVPTTGPEVAVVEAETPAPSEPVVAVEEAIPAVSTPAETPGLAVDLLASRPSLVDRSGVRVAKEVQVAEVTLEAISAAEKRSNAQARAATTAAPSLVVRSTVVVKAVAKTPTPKPVAKPATPKSKPLGSTASSSAGGWVELPNVRAIPAASYAKIHQWDPMVNKWAAYYKVDPDLIRRIIYVESRGNPNDYVASTGVKGLMQVAPMWFKAGENPYDPYTNIGRGTYILRRGYDAYHNWFKAVSYYCYGPIGRYGANIPTFYAGLVFSPINKGL